MVRKVLMEGLFGKQRDTAASLAKPEKKTSIIRSMSDSTAWRMCSGMMAGLSRMSSVLFMVRKRRERRGSCSSGGVLRLRISQITLLDSPTV